MCTLYNTYLFTHPAWSCTHQHGRTKRSTVLSLYLLRMWQSVRRDLRFNISSRPYLDSEYWISRSGCVTFCTIILSNSILNLCVLSFYATSRVPIVSPDDTWRPETVSKNQLAYSIRRSGSPNLWDALLWKNQLPTYYCAYTWSLNCTCYTIYDILLHSISIS